MNTSEQQQALLQTTFDRVWVHLNKQGKAAMSGGSCVYLAKDGGMCAVGCLLDRSKETGDFEEFTINQLISFRPSEYEDEEGEEDSDVHRYHNLKAALAGSGLDPANLELMDLLEQLQTAHDEQLNNRDCPEAGLENWRNAMGSIAFRLNLTKRPIDFALPA